MKKFFSVLIIGFIAVTAVSYFGMQWRIKTGLEEAFQSMQPFVDASFESLRIDQKGRIAVDNINFFVSMADLNISIGSVGLSTSSFWETLKLQSDLEKGKLPSTLKIDIRNLNVDFTDGMADTFSSMPTNAGLFSQLITLGCGRTTSLGAREIYDMGVKSITLDSYFGYEYDNQTDELVSTIDLSLDGLFSLNQEQVTLGAYGFLDNYKDLVSNPNFTGISTKRMSLEFADLGFLDKVHSYCGKSAGISKSEWIALNSKMVNAAMSQINFQATFDHTDIYTKLQSPRTKVKASLVPLAGFNFNDLSFYNVADLIDLVDFKVSVNDEFIPVEGMSWNKERLQNLNLKSIRNSYRTNSQDKNADENQVSGNSSSRALLAVKVSDLDKYVNRTVYLERNDGTKFIGAVTQVTWDKVFIRARYKSGYADISIVRNKIKSAKLYPE